MLLRDDAVPDRVVDGICGALEAKVLHDAVFVEFHFVNEIGYLTCDPHAADLLFQVVTRRYASKSIVLATNLPFKQWDTVFPNASCAVALIDRLTHHAEIISIEGESYRKRDAERSQKSKR